VKNGIWIGKICLQGTFKPVFEMILHSGARGCSEVYARRILAPLSLFSSDFAGSNPAVRQKRIASGLDLSFGTQEDSTRRESFRVTQTRFVIIRQREKCPGISLGAMQKRALPESGYRVIPIGAKRLLSAPCRKHLSLQPLLLHE
jgi:hypothetical protein